ncbi:MFS transporter [Streptomyces griseoluteus]
MTRRTSSAAAPAAAAGGDAPVPLRRNRDFMRLWVGASISQFGSRVGLTAFPLLVLYHTGSAFQSGLVGFAAALPNLTVQLPAGALVDRWDRRRIMLWCNVLGTLAMTSVAVAVLCGHIWLTHLMLAAFVDGSRGIFVDLAERATVRTVVTREQLPAALSQNEARRQAMGLAGQPTGGFLLTVAGWLPFACTAVADAVATLCFLRIRGKLKRAPQGPRRPLLADIKEGIGRLWQARFARVLVGLIAGSNFVFQALVLTVMVVLKHGGYSPTTVSLVTACGGVGGLLGALSASAARRVSMRTTLLLGCTVWALLVPLTAYVTGPVALALLLGAVSCICGLLNVAAGVYQTQHTPDELQGRVQGTARFLGSGANSLGFLTGGYLLGAVGVATTGLSMGAAMVLLALAVACLPAARAEHEPFPGESGDLAEPGGPVDRADNGGGSGRGDLADRGRGADRSEHGARSDRADGAGRGGRGDRSDGGDRAGRAEHGGRGDPAGGADRCDRTGPPILATVPNPPAVLRTPSQAYPRPQPQPQVHPHPHPQIHDVDDTRGDRP